MPQNPYIRFTESLAASFHGDRLDNALRALRMAVQGLGTRLRYDGSPFVYHSILTAQIVLDEVGLGNNSVIATLLHDLAREGVMPVEEIDRQFGRECGGIVRGLCNISGVDPKTSSLQADNFRELIISYSTDPRVILIKMADRLEVMRSLEMFPELKRNKKSWETLNLYSQIAHKLGLYSIKSEMEDLALRWLEPRDWAEITRKLSEGEQEREQFIKRFSEPIENKLKELGITDYKLKGRTKSVYSIWRKMKAQKVSFEEVYDLFAIRIVIDCPPEREKMLCWSVFSVVTDFYTPNPSRMRDWISLPKSNGYESLHATVVTPEGRWVEVQIRTQRMDEVAERGVAAHWRYKGVGGSRIGSEEWLGRLREIVETSSENVSERFDLALSSDEIFVFTPNGDLRRLPAGSTVLDFAFDIHSNLGSSCTGARINGRNVSIRERLHGGDVVEILSSKSQRAKSDWLSIVVTSKARSKIKQILREDEARSAQLGREELERKLKNWKLPLGIEEAVNALSKYYKVKTGLEVYALVASQRIPVAELKDVLTRAAEGTLQTAAAPAPRKQPRATAERDDDNYLVIDESLKQVDYKLAKCCNPIFGDPIFGFVTISAGITIHRNDCPNATRLREQYPYRILDARWKDTVRGGAFRATLRVQGEDTSGIVNRITDLITHDLKINIRSVAFSAAQGSVDGTVSIEVTNAQAVDMVIHKIKKVKGVTRAYRVN